MDAVIVFGEKDFLMPRIVQIPNVKKVSRNCVQIQKLAIQDEQYAVLATSQSVHLLNLKTLDFVELTNLFHSPTSKYIHLTQ